MVRQLSRSTIDTTKPLPQRAATAALLLVLSVAGFCQLPWSRRPKPAMSIGVNPDYDARYVSDLYAIGRSVTSSPALRLVLCDIVPDHQSGIDIEYVTPDPKTHRYVMTGKGEPACDFGTYRAVGGLGCVPRFTAGTFRWRSPRRNFGEPLYMSMTDPFANGGTAAIVAPASGRLTTHPDPTYALIPETVDAVRGELEFVKDHPSWAAKTAVDAGLALQREQLNGANPLIVMDATRALAESGNLDVARARQLITETSEQRQALEVVAILCSLSREQEATLGRALLGAVDAAKTTEDLKGLLIGAAVAFSNLAREQRRGLVLGYTSPPPPLVGEAVFARSIITKILAKQRAMRTHTAADTYVESFYPWPM